MEQKLLLWCALLGTALNATQLLLVSRLNVVIGLSDKLFVLGDYAMLSTLGEVGAGLIHLFNTIGMHAVKFTSIFDDLPQHQRDVYWHHVLALLIYHVYIQHPGTSSHGGVCISRCASNFIFSLASLKASQSKHSCG